MAVDASSFLDGQLTETSKMAVVPAVPIKSRDKPPTPCQARFRNVLP